jgi:hypothetical protein
VNGIAWEAGLGMAGISAPVQLAPEHVCRREIWLVLFRYLLVRTRTRLGNSPAAFKSVTAQCEAA